MIFSCFKYIIGKGLESDLNLRKHTLDPKMGSTNFFTPEFWGKDFFHIDDFRGRLFRPVTQRGSDIFRPLLEKIINTILEYPLLLEKMRSQYFY